MKHTINIVPIRTSRNKFNSSIPFRVVFSGTFNKNVYYDLSSAYLKLKLRCKPNDLKCIEVTSSSTDVFTTWTGDFYTPVYNSTPVDYIGGFFSVFDDEGAEMKFELNNINNEESGNHSALMEFLEKTPIEFAYNTHIRKLWNGQQNFNMRSHEGESAYQFDRAQFKQLKTFNNKYRWHKESDGYYYTTMYIPFSQVLEPAHKMSLLRIYASEFDIFFKDCNKFFNTRLPHVIINSNKGTKNSQTKGEGFVTLAESANASAESFDNFQTGHKLLYDPDTDNNFWKEEPVIVDCDMMIDEYTIETTEEIASIGNQYFQPCVFQLDNHVMELNKEIGINKFKLEVPFKSSACYYYFTRDDNNTAALRNDYLYLNPPSHAVLKTLTGFSTPFPDYYNEGKEIQDNLEKVYNTTSNKLFSKPEARHYDELLYNLKKFNQPQIDYESWLQIHRIYSIDMNSDLNQSPDKNTFFFEIGLQEEMDDNVKLHMIFVRDYTD